MKLSHRRRSLFVGLAVAAVVGVAARPGWLWAKHATNAGPADPPIKFPVPTPKPLTPEEEAKTFKLPAGFTAQLVAAEPMVQDPIAMAWDGEGRLWVVEMRGYMHDVDGKGEDQPLGRISILEDTDGDGRMDKSTVFLEGLIMPRAVLPTRGGALVVEPPNLTFYKTGKDGKAGEKTVIATDYGTKGGQPEHMANGLFPAMDNWIYNASHHSRYRYQEGKWLTAPMSSRGQWGVTQDDFGRLYYNSNSDLGRADPYPQQYFSRNPSYKVTAATNVELLAVKEQEVWPSHMTPGVNRGYEPNELRPDGTLHHPTATCGLGAYRGELFPTEFQDNLFIPEPSANVIKRMLLVEEAGRIAMRDAYQRVDFMTSTDERFRPVNVYTGPDGALYVVDMYRGVLQHTAFLTNYLIKNIKERHLEQPIQQGRIWRIVPEGSTPKATTLPTKDPKALVALLRHPNGWVRDMAQRLLVESPKGAVVTSLEQMASSSAENPLARLHALWTLEGMGRLDGGVAVAALGDADPHVRCAAIRLCEPLLIPATRAQAMPGLLKLAASDASPQVQMQLALTLSAVPDADAEAAVARLLTATTADPAWMRDAVLSGLRGRELEFAERLLALPEWKAASPEKETVLVSLAQCVLAEHRTARVKHLLELAGQEPEGNWRQVALLKGAAPRVVAAKKKAASVDKAEEPSDADAAPRVKLIYLDSAPEALVALSKSKSPAVQKLAAQVDGRLAWPGKPGVPPPPKVVPLTPAEQAQFDKGQVVFGQTCAACHQPSGLGQEGLAPPLVDSEWVLGNDRRIARIVLQGLSGPISVNGTPFALEMPPLTTLSDEDIAAVLTYVRRQPEWEHNAAPVKVDTIRAVREETKERAETWTAKELVKVK